MSQSVTCGRVSNYFIETADESERKRRFLFKWQPSPLSGSQAVYLKAPTRKK